MNIYDTYGFKSEDLEEVRKLFEMVSRVILDRYKSDYMRGIYYSKGRTNEENYILRRNYSDEEGWTEEEHKNLGVILYISRSERIDELRRLLLNNFQGDIFFIERVVITEDRLYQKYQYIHGKDKLIFERNVS
ncbi:hypothetical protein [Nostoc commune]|uniref:hypothetical protein n=1 Tax=Nostoc commune TaxID=1178 RepID=UPI0018C69CE8|nr:hypothetical protein [Nostoc commune]MBG1262972.1 hypothetical protein [Nostoc commune BAE]